MITAQQAADKWGTSLRNVQDLCKRGRIVGAERWGAAWMIPADAPKPLDGRSKQAKTQIYTQPLIRKSPFLSMTDLYQNPGTIDAAIASLDGFPEAKLLLQAEAHYCRGQIDKVYAYAQQILENNSGLYAVLAGGMLLAKCAVWNGDVNLYQQAKRHLYEAPWKTLDEKDIVLLAIASTDLTIRNTKDFPDWFMRGDFTTLHPDSFPAAFVHYAKFLMIATQDQAINTIKGNASSTIMMRNLTYVIEPLISQVAANRIILPEIYLRLICAICYSQGGMTKRAAAHIDRAIELALPDQQCAPFVLYRRQLGLLLDERLQQFSPELCKKVKEMHKQYNAGWTKLHNELLQKTVQFNLTSREREVARLVAFGLSNAEISQQLNISQHSVNAIIIQARNKTGASNRADLGLYI